MYEIQFHPADIRKQVRYYFLSRPAMRWLWLTGLALALLLLAGAILAPIGVQSLLLTGRLRFLDQKNETQKAILAIKGGREERTILIRDTNRLVALAVMKNPRMPEGEVEAIAGMRNVREEVLRTIGATREWTKNYAVALALVRNPRTPPGISTNFITRLNNKDLKFLSKDKNVPEIVRRMAKKNSDLRQQRSKVSFKKH